MAITLDNSIGGLESNSYVNSTYFDDYWTNHFNQILAAQVAALTGPQTDYLLVRACRILESLRFTRPISRMDYQLRYNRLTGTVVDMSYLTREPVKFAYFQKLQFPRNLDVHIEDGTFIIPEPILMAQCEQAAYLLNFDETAIANRLQGITMDKVGVGRQQIDLTQEYGASGSVLAPMAHELIRPYLVGTQHLRRA
jgi:hypothetical protein